MNPSVNAEASPEPLFELLAGWERLTEQERVAIDGDRWDDLARIQGAKRQLRQRIESRPVPGDSRGQALAATAARVQALERGNQAVLAAKLQATRSRLEELGAAARHIRGLHKAYSAGAPTGWQWYS